MTADPAAVWRVIHGYTGYWAVVAAVRLGVFDALVDGPLDVDRLAERCDAPGARLAVIADALAALGLLIRQADGYRLSDTADALLVTGRPRSMCDLVIWSPGPDVNWPALDATVRGAGPPAPVEEDGARFYARLAPATFPSQLVVARAALAAVAPAPGARLLELGAGRGPWATALLESDPGASAVLNDLAPVIEATPAALGALASRCSFLPGDYLAVELPPERFDLVVLGHVLRAEPDERAGRLVARAASAVAPGGRLVVTEYLGGRDPATHPQAALLAATMLAATVDGRLCTPAMLDRWLGAAGCSRVAGPEPVANTDIIVAAPSAPV